MITITKILGNVMNVLVDTSIWSLALRKKAKNEYEQQIVGILNELINTNSVRIIGAIRQEILSGIPSQDLFNRLSKSLATFQDLAVDTNIHIKAAECFNICRRNGVQGSHIDFLICATSIHYNIPIFTLDKDFVNYSQYIGLNIFNSELIF